MPTFYTQQQPGGTPPITAPPLPNDLYYTHRMLITVRVKAGAKKESFRKISDDRFEISVREKPENNLANHRIIALVAIQFDVPASKIRIVKGHRQRSKTLSIGSR
ncbi:MAG: DUF167 domain-containing protein [Xanthobacteraceae bacterium]